MTNLDLAHLRATNLQRLTRWGVDHLTDWSVSDWVTATVGEMGESANIVKKLNRVRDGIAGNKETPEELRAALAKELGDTLIYLDLWAAAAGIDLAEATIRAFNDKSDELGWPEKLGDDQPADLLLFDEVSTDMTERQETDPRIEAAAETLKIIPA